MSESVHIAKDKILITNSFKNLAKYLKTIILHALSYCPTYTYSTHFSVVLAILISLSRLTKTTL